MHPSSAKLAPLPSRGKVKSLLSVAGPLRPAQPLPSCGSDLSTSPTLSSQSGLCCFPSGLVVLLPQGVCACWSFSLGCSSQHPQVFAQSESQLSRPGASHCLLRLPFIHCPSSDTLFGVSSQSNVNSDGWDFACFLHCYVPSA